MRNRKWIGGIGMVVAVALVAGRAVSQDKHAEPSKKEEGKGGVPLKMPSPDEIKKMMEAAAALAKPSEHHQALEALAGTWDVNMKMYMDPSMPPIESKATAERKWILGGRYLEFTIKGELLMPDPKSKMGMAKKAYEGHGVLGYDNFRNLYVGDWASNISTALLTFSGQMDQSGKVLTTYGTMDEPMMKVVGRMVKHVTTIESKDKHTFVVYDLHAGPDYKVFEWEFTRKGE